MMIFITTFHVLLKILLLKSLVKINISVKENKIFII